jgi:hypothetical protein
VTQELGIARELVQAPCEQPFTAFRLYRIVLAIIPFPANPMDTMTGVERPGTVTRRTRME